jgi:large subunit ribosomal protein L7/L12
MSTAEATQYDSNVKTLGDSIVALTLLQAKQLADYLENVHGIKPAAGGAVVMAGPAAGGGAAPAAAEKTEFDVVLTAAGDNKIGSGGDGPGPEGSEGLGRGGSEAGQDRSGEG